MSSGNSSSKVWRSTAVLMALSASCAALTFAACTTDDPKENQLSSVPGVGTGSQTSGTGGFLTGSGGASSGTGAISSFGGDAGGPGTGGTIDFGCGAPPVKEGAFSKKALREAAAACAQWQYCNFEGAASELEKQTLAYQKDPTAKKLAAAQESYRVAMNVWSSAELFQFGPLPSNVDIKAKDVYAGQNIRANIYAWPDVSRCAADEQIVGEKYKQFGVDGAGVVKTSGRGLWGIEYMLFYPGSDTGCQNLGLSAKTYAAWQALSASDIAERRRDYAAALSSDVVVQTKRLIDLWKPDGGNFEKTFVDAADPPYPSEQEVMNVLAWALLYLEVEVKDWKLGSAAGYTPADQRKDAESPFAGLATENLRANLRGFRALFEGCGENGEGIGFDDWLRAVGQGELADDMVAAYENAQATLDAFPRWSDASNAQIQAEYLEVKKLTDLLKSDFFGPGSALVLKLPAGVASDTD